MFLERFGKFCFLRMHFLVFFSLLCFPIFLATTYLIFKKIELKNLEESFSSTSVKGLDAIEKKQKKERFLKRYSITDPYFINKIESLSFLQTEQEELKKLIRHPAVSNKKTFKERLSFLLSEENRLAFAEENILSSSKIKETEEKQRHPVQMDDTDLQQLLSLIEDVPYSAHPSSASPQLILRNFHLKKRETPLCKQVFEIEMDLLKREWTQ